MNKKVISFVSPNFQQGPKEFNSYYLPYTPAVIWSYVNQFDEINENYILQELIWKRENIEDVVSRLKTNDVVGFSCYIWNRNYCKVLARELKKANPNILIIFGGPEPPITKPNFFELLPYVDICVKLEGEITLKKILLEYLKSKPDYTTIKGILINKEGKTINTGESFRIEFLDEIPSPYLTGLFDGLLKNNPDVRWSATLETNRGCPYACTFCDWGSLTYNKIKKFNLERVFGELEWIGKNGLDFVSITDANFGIFTERDNLIADKLIATQKEYGNPKSYTISWAKNQKKEVVDIVKKLIYEGNSKIGLNLSVQTMNESVLDLIKRKNLETHRIEEVFKMCEDNNIPLFTELILGLPGETLETWKENFYTLYKSGNHTGITIYQAQLLENAEMNLTQKDLFDMKGSIVYDYLVGSYNENELKEGIEVVVSTKDLPREKMLDAQLFSWFQNTFHINGVTNFISRFLYKKYGVEYSDFYDKLWNFIQSDDWVSKEIKRIKHHYSNWTDIGSINHTPIQGMEIHGWNLIHSSLINLHAENRHDELFLTIEKFLRKEFIIDSRLIDDLINLQKSYLINYYHLNAYPIKKKFTYDLIGYLLNDKDIYNNCEYTFDTPEDKNQSLNSFCEQIFFGRRRNFGKAWISQKEII